MADTETGKIDANVATQVGEALGAWAHLTGVMSRRLPSQMGNANRIRRAANAKLATPRRRRP